MSTKRPLREEAMELAPGLFEDLGFRVVQEFYDLESGAARLTLKSPHLLLLFERDGRMDETTITQVASTIQQPPKWWLADFVIEVVKGAAVQPSLPMSFLEGATLVRDNIALLERAMDEDYPQVVDSLKRRIYEKSDENRRLSQKLIKAFLAHGRPERSSWAEKKRRSFWPF